VKIADPLRQTLIAVADRLHGTRHDWWIISSAAVALHGGDPGAVGDVDILLDPRDVPVVFAALGLPLDPGQGTTLFRSEWFGTWRGAPLPVELFAGFASCEGGVWNAVLPKTRQAVTVGGAALYVPERRELKAMLLRFGRPKDLARAATL
jgi:hypothetical protein